MVSHPKIHLPGLVVILFAIVVTNFIVIVAKKMLFSVFWREQGTNIVFGYTIFSSLEIATTAVDDCQQKLYSSTNVRLRTYLVSLSVPLFVLGAQNHLRP
jgi:hypothetical protein